MTVNAQQVADFFIELAHMRDERIDNLKLNKLLFYAQAASLQKYGSPLFHERIEAWDYGPVVPDIYHAYRNFGASPITEARLDTSNARIIEKPGSPEWSLILDVYASYGAPYTACDLVALTHMPDTPWSAIYNSNNKHAVIPHSLITDWVKKEPLAIDLPDIIGELEDEDE